MTTAELPERFWAKVNKEGPIPSYAPKLGSCWIWTAGLDDAGYGRYELDGWNQKAYHVLNGHPPTGMQVDHLCRVRSCIRPEHLEFVTPRTNTLRGNAPAARHAVATHCPSGHPYDLFNTRWTPEGYRKCHECERQRSTRRRQAKRGALS